MIYPRASPVCHNTHPPNTHTHLLLFTPLHVFSCITASWAPLRYLQAHSCPFPVKAFCVCALCCFAASVTPSLLPCLSTPLFPCSPVSHLLCTGRLPPFPKQHGTRIRDNDTVAACRAHSQEYFTKYYHT